MNKIDVYQQVTDRIICQLEQGVIPWKKPWVGFCSSGAYNIISKKRYSLLNELLLPQPGPYATYKQWSEKGGQVRKGEKGETVVFWKWIEKEQEPDASTEEGDQEKKIKKIPYLKKYTVFHISQVDGVDAEIPLGGVDPAAECVTADQVLMGYVSRESLDYHEIQSNKAYYNRIQDKVIVPCRAQFHEIAEFYSTAFHECMHSTGHRNRLGRFKENAPMSFGDQDYSKEELVAEIGAASILNLLGLETEHSFRNNVAYIQSWLNQLKNDKRLIVSAAGKAEKAAKYFMGEHIPVEQKEEVI